MLKRSSGGGVFDSGGIGFNAVIKERSRQNCGCLQKGRP